MSARAGGGAVRHRAVHARVGMRRTKGVAELGAPLLLDVARVGHDSDDLCPRAALKLDALTARACGRSPPGRPTRLAERRVEAWVARRELHVHVRAILTRAQQGRLGEILAA